MAAQASNIAKTRTVLVGKTRVNWLNVSCVTIDGIGVGDKDPDYYKIGIKWKYKASIRTRVVKLSREINLPGYFKKFGLVQLGSYFINLSKIMTLDESPVHGPVEKTRYTILFSDGFEIHETIKTDFWLWWKTTYI
jgi:hypothetical protein